MKRLYVWMFAAFLMAVVGVVGVESPQAALAQEECLLGFGQLSSISGNGRYVVFQTGVSFEAGDERAKNDVYRFDQMIGSMVKVTDSTWWEDVSYEPKISNAGRYVTFHTQGQLVTTDTNFNWDVYVKDMSTGETTLVSLPQSGQVLEEDSLRPTMTSDGQFISFVSYGRMVDEDTNSLPDAYLRDIRNGTTVLISVDKNGGAAGVLDTSRYPSSVSGDGRFATFASVSSDIVEADTNGVPDVFVHDLGTGIVSRVSVSSSGDQANAGSSEPVISSSGDKVAFISYASNLVATDTNGKKDVFVHDLKTGVTTLASVSTEGVQGNADATNLTMSEDGSSVAWVSRASNLVAGDDDDGDVFVRDLSTGETVIASVAGGSAYPDSPFNANLPSISSDGRYVSYESRDYNLTGIPREEHSGQIIYIFDRVNDSIEHIAQPAHCVPGSGQLSGVSGVVADHEGTLLAGVDVVANPGGYTTKTDAQGAYTLTVPTGTYTVEVAVVPDYTSYPVQQVVEVVQDTTLEPFTYYPCISPHTSLDVCDLEVGDILFDRGGLGLSSLLRIGLGSYWFHAGMYVGGNEVSHARGQFEDDDEEVQTDPIFKTSWWTKEEVLFDEYDWAVIRPEAPSNIKQRAAEYAREKADQVDPPSLYIPHPPTLPNTLSGWTAFISLFADYRDSETHFFCSQFVWKAYQLLGLDLEVNLGAELTEDIRRIVTADDVYYSNYVGTSTVVQRNPDESIVRRMSFLLLSPADLLLTDSQGRRVGHDPITGETFNEIPGAVYTGENAHPETITLKVAEGESFTLSATGTGSGEYTIITSVMGDDEERSDFIQSSIEPDETVTYDIDPFAPTNEEIIVEEEDDLFEIFLPITMTK